MEAQPPHPLHGEGVSVKVMELVVYNYDTFTPYYNCFQAAVAVQWFGCQLVIQKISWFIPRWGYCYCFPEQGTLLTLLKSAQLY